MCWQITVGVSGYGADPIEAFVARGLHAEASNNPVRAALGADTVKLSISDGHCACALYPGTRNHQPEDEVRLRERYERKRWPVNKIERAIRARVAANLKRASTPEQHNHLPAIVQQFVDAGARVSLLAHFFQGSFGETFDIVGRSQVTLAEFIAGRGAFPEDTVVTIVP
jgi:hypothetical protein